MFFFNLKMKKILKTHLKLFVWCVILQKSSQWYGSGVHPTGFNSSQVFADVTGSKLVESGQSRPTQCWRETELIFKIFIELCVIFSNVYQLI